MFELLLSHFSAFEENQVALVDDVVLTLLFDSQPRIFLPVAKNRAVRKPPYVALSNHWATQQYGFCTRWWDYAQDYPSDLLSHSSPLSSQPSWLLQT